MRAVLRRLRSDLGRAVYKGYERLLGVRNQIRDRLFGKPDVIVVGEHHYNMLHAHTIARWVWEHRPEYVLMECFINKTPDELEEFVKRYRVRTLEDVCRHYGVSLEDLGIDENIVYDIRGELGLLFLKKTAYYRDVLGKSRAEAVRLAMNDLRVEGHEPKSMDELKKVPLFFLHPVALRILQERIADGWCKYGDEHSAGNVIGMLRHIGRYVRTGKYSDVIRARRCDLILGAAADVGAKVAGCDIKRPDFVKILRHGLSERLLNEFSPPYRSLVRQLAGKYKLSPENPGKNRSNVVDFVRELCKVLGPVRDHTMSRSILEYTRRRTSDAPVIAVVGAAHIPGICKNLEKAKVKYRAIKLPSFAVGSTFDYLRG